MSIYQLLGYLSALFCVIAYVPYVRSARQHTTQPHPVSWLLWAILGLVSLVTYRAAGAHDTLPLAVMNFVGPLSIFLATARYWKGGFTRFDYWCLSFSLVAIVVYLVFHTAVFALAINLLGDLFAALPTIRKTYLHPQSENLTTWVLFTIAAVLSLLAIQEWNIGVILLPLYLAVFELGMSILVLRGRLKKA